MGEKEQSIGENDDTILENEKETKFEVDQFQIDSAQKRPDTPFMYFTVLTVLLLNLVGATTLVWSSPALVKLKSNDTEVNPLGRPIETIEISMLTGIPGMAGLFSTFLLPKLADVLGRKLVIFSFGVGMLFSMIGTAFSNKLYLFIIFNSISSMLQTATYVLVPIYLTEISETHNRAKFGCLMSIFLPMGQLYTYVDGPIFTVKYFTLINAAPLIPFLLLFLLAPESPVYSLSRGRTEECMKTLKKLRSNKTSQEIEKDFEQIKLSLESQVVVNEYQIITIFKTKEGRLAMVLAGLPTLFQVLSGAPTMMMLLAPILNETGTISGNVGAIIVGVIKVCCFFLTFLIVERTGRKPLLIISSIGAGIAMFSLGLYFYFKNTDPPFLDQLKFLPILSVILFFILYAVGLGPIPLTVLGEMFPPSLRPVAVGFVSTITGGVLSIYTFSYPLLAEWIGTYSCLWIFAGSCFVSAVLTFTILPETKGKSVVEIQQILKDY